MSSWEYEVLGMIIVPVPFSGSIDALTYEWDRTSHSVRNRSNAVKPFEHELGTTIRLVIVLGIDPGSAVCGYGVVALEAGALRMLDAGIVRTDPEQSDAERLRRLHAALRELLTEHRPERVGIERLYFQRNVQTAMAVGQARGIALLAAAEAGVPIDEPTPNEVKQAVCGNGAADKAQVAAMVGRLLGIAVAGVPDDATDALAVAIGCAHRGAARPKAVIG
jgi:crossover junction endodeoxyribonuclease RuvC